MAEVISTTHPGGEQEQHQELLPDIHPANRDLVAAGAATADGGDPTGSANRLRTLDAVLRQIADREAELHRDRFPISQIRVETDRLIAGNKELRLDAEGLRRLCKWFKAPADYLATLKPELRGRILQDHFAEGRCADAKLTDKTSCVLSRGGAFLDLGRFDLLTLDNTAVVQAVREGVPGDAPVLEVQNLHLDDDFFALDVVSPRIADEVRPGDVLLGGVHVSHSQFDGQATQVMAYVVRLACENGMVQRQCLGEKRRSTPRTRRLSADRPEAKEMQMAQIRKLVGDTWSGLVAKLEAIRRLRDKEVEVKSILDRFLRQAHLFSHSLMNLLLQAWQKEGAESSAFGALNALTRVATHARQLPDWQRQRLARLAGVFANQNEHLCPHCFSILATR